MQSKMFIGGKITDGYYVPLPIFDVVDERWCANNIETVHILSLIGRH